MATKSSKLSLAQLLAQGLEETTAPRPKIRPKLPRAVWKMEEIQLIVWTSKCRHCGTKSEATQSLRIRYSRNGGRSQQWTELSIALNFFPEGVPRKILKHEEEVPFCHHCFLRDSTPPQEIALRMEQISLGKLITRAKDGPVNTLHIGQ